MKQKTSLLSIFFTLLFAATLTLTGCTAGSLTGPSPDQDTEKTVQADQSVNPPAMRNGDNGAGRGGNGPGHNTTNE